MHKSYVKYVHDMPISVVNLCSITVMLMHTHVISTILIWFFQCSNIRGDKDPRTKQVFNVNVLYLAQCKVQ